MRRLIWIALALLLPGSICHAADSATSPLTLVKAGTPTATIVVPRAPNRVAQFAARELQYHVRLITGAELPIVDERADLPKDSVRILVGESALTKALGLDAAKFKPQEYLVDFRPDTLILMGEDERPDPYRINVCGNYDLTDGRFGKAWKRAYARYFEISDHGFSDDAGTFEVWVRSGTDGGSGGDILDIQVPGSGHLLQMQKGLRYTTWNGDKKNVVESKEWPLPDGWHHLMVTWDTKAGRQDMFVDGRSVGSSKYDKTSCASAPQLRTGVMCWGPLDELRLSGGVRSVEPGGPKAAFKTDDYTRLLIHFDDPAGPADDSGRVDPNAMPGLFGKHATEYAVYDFIEKFLGVRWYFPTELGMVYTKTHTLSVSGHNIRRSPAMQFRNDPGGYDGMCFASDAMGGQMGRILCNNPGDQDKMLYCHRLRAGGRRLLASHSLAGYGDRFWAKNPNNPGAFEESHPEYFAQGWPDAAPNWRQVCFSSTGLVAQLVKDANEYFETGGHKPGDFTGPDYFSIMPIDNGDWCKCTNCQALMRPDPDAGFANGKCSQAFWSFAAKVAREVLKTHPDKMIATTCYQDYSDYPTNIDLPPNLFVGPCLATRSRFSLDPSVNHEMALYKEWVRKEKANGRLMSLWLYQCFPTESGAMKHFKPFPGFHAHSLEQSMRMFNQDKVDGVFLCGIAEYIDGWLTHRYMDDPTPKVDVLLDEFFTRYYGPAAAPMKAFYLETEARYLEPNYNPRSGCEDNGNNSWCSRATPPVMKKLGGLMDQARQRADKDPYKQRVSVFKQGVWDYMQASFNEWVAKQTGGQHPYPFRIQADKLETTKIDGPFSAIAGNGAYFRNGVNCLGLLDHRFDDRRGTMEAWVKCGPVRPDFCQGPGPVFEITPSDLSSGHRVSVDSAGNAFVATYEVWVGGKTNRLVATKLATNTWHHLMASWSVEQGMRFCVDGKPVGKPTPYKPTACAKAGSFDIAGTVKFSGGGGFGPIDEVRLSNVVRKPGKPVAPYKTDKNTLLLLSFDEAPGESVKDHSGVER